MDFTKYPLPIIDLINSLDNWSIKQTIPFERKAYKDKGFVWISKYSEHFEFRYNLQLATSSEQKEVFSFGIGGNPKDEIEHDSKLNILGLIINHPYTLDIEKLIKERLQKQFDLWTNRINTFESKTLFERVPVRHYEKEFFDHFEIMEDEASTSPFDHNRQILLEELIDKTNHALSFQKKRSNSSQIEEVIEYGKEIKKQIPISSKNKVLNGLSKYYAKIRSIGAQLSFEVLKFLTVEGVKAIIKSIPQ